jgi:hypothetical protein
VENSRQDGHRFIPVPLHLWHLTTLSPFLRVPLPSQFLHFSFFLTVFFSILPSSLTECDRAIQTRTGHTKANALRKEGDAHAFVLVQANDHQAVRSVWTPSG